MLLLISCSLNTVPTRSDTNDYLQQCPFQHFRPFLLGNLVVVFLRAADATRTKIAMSAARRRKAYSQVPWFASAAINFKKAMLPLFPAHVQ